MVRDLGNARREPSRITDSPNSPPFSSKRKSNSPSLHCRAVDISVGSSGKPTCLGFCDRRLPPPSFANSASTFSFFLPSCAWKRKGSVAESEVQGDFRTVSKQS